MKSQQYQPITHYQTEWPLQLTPQQRAQLIEEKLARARALSKADRQNDQHTHRKNHTGSRQSR